MMAFHPLATLAVLCLAFAAAQAALPGEVYWNSALPNTTMPRAISSVLLPGNEEEILPDLRRSGYKRKHYTFGVTEDGVVVPDLRRSGYSRKHYTLGNEQRGVVSDLRGGVTKDGVVVPDIRRSGYSRKHYTLENEQRGVVPDLRRSGYKRKHYTLNNEESNVVPDLRRSGYKRKHYTDGEVVPDLRRSGYKRKHYTLNTENNEEIMPQLRRSGYKRKEYTLGSEKNQLLVNPPSAPWFLEKDLYQGKQIEMEIARPENDGYHFVPRQVADSIPFSSAKFSTILDKLSIKLESPKAELMKATLKECELPAEEGEVKTCATSLESMIDFSIQHLGKHIQAFSTEAEKTTKLQKFTILKGIKQIGHNEAVACHKQNYPYAVFYCHDVKGARAYVVSFIGASGTKVKAVGVCHTNTSAWSPEHEAFKILKVKPGGEPICHFLPEYNVLWTTK